MREKEPRMYILVNKDIQLTKAKLGVQVGHAVDTFVYETLVNGSESDIQVLKDYRDTDRLKIILACSEKQLRKLEVDGYTTVRDLGYTEVEPNTLTCVHLGIMTKEDIPKWAKRLQMYK